MAWTVSINLETHPDTLRVARRMIYATVKQEGLSEEKARELELATGEALGNARYHAYTNGVGPVTVDLTSQIEAFVVTIHNAGAPVSPPEVPTSLPHYQEAGHLPSDVQNIVRAGHSKSREAAEAQSWACWWTFR